MNDLVVIAENIYKSQKLCPKLRKENQCHAVVSQKSLKMQSKAKKKSKHLK